MKKEEIIEIRNVLDLICKNGINEEYIRELYRLTGNENIPLSFSNLGNNSAYFNPKHMFISVNDKRLENWLKETIDYSLHIFNIKDKKVFESYLLLSILLHEIEHSNQKLIADSKKECNYEYKHQAYSDIFDAMSIKQYLIPRPISLVRDIVQFTKYKKNAYNLLLERNASVESYNTCSLIADTCNDEDIKNFMITSRNAFMLIGYLNVKEGALKYTYDTIMMSKKYNKLDIPEDLDLKEKAREGLELNIKERNELVLILKDSSKFK